MTNTPETHTQQRDEYDRTVEALVERYAAHNEAGKRLLHCEHSAGFWPYLMIEGREGPHQIVTFRGFAYDWSVTVPREQFMDFFTEALALLESYPPDAYGLGDGKA